MRPSGLRSMTVKSTADCRSTGVARRHDSGPDRRRLDSRHPQLGGGRPPCTPDSVSANRRPRGLLARNESRGGPLAGRAGDGRPAIERRRRDKFARLLHQFHARARTGPLCPRANEAERPPTLRSGAARRGRNILNDENQSRTVHACAGRVVRPPSDSLGVLSRCSKVLAVRQTRYHCCRTSANSAL